MEKFFDFLQDDLQVNHRVAYLISGFLTGVLKGEEREELDLWILATDERWKDATIEEVMRQIERWYDARVIFEDNIRYHFNGTFDRCFPVSKILFLLEETGHVHFTINGKQLL